MSNRRKLRPRDGGGVPRRYPSAAPFDFNRVARKSCSECGAPVRWVDAAGAREHGMDVEEALGFLGARSVDEVECWVCTVCDNAGVMGPTASG
jgi:hypothetical protein